VTITPGKVVATVDVEPVRWTVEQGRFLLRSTDTGGLFSLFELTTPPGGGPPPHRHDREDETFYVLEGRYEIRLGDDLHVAGPGTVVHGPRTVPHGFRNVGDAPARMLCVATPGGAERMFEELAELTSAGPPDRGRVLELAARHGLSYLLPSTGGAR
jgi:quercetin dioxygenase-like cupin family protein